MLNTRGTSAVYCVLACTSVVYLYERTCTCTKLRTYDMSDIAYAYVCLSTRTTVSIPRWHRVGTCQYCSSPSFPSDAGTHSTSSRAAVACDTEVEREYQQIKTKEKKGRTNQPREHYTGQTNTTLGRSFGRRFY